LVKPIQIYPRSERVESLEFVRGVAALIVVFWHTTLAFFPERAGIFADLDQSNSLSGSPVFALLNGGASVVLFFVLSGYVLTYSFFSTGECAGMIRTAQRRIPRLAFLTTFVCCLSWLLFALGAYYFAEAGVASRSPWLAGFGYAAEIPENRTLLSAFLQGAFWTFFRGDSYFNSSMWTMKWELVGSYLAFGLAFIVFNIKSIIWRYYIFGALVLYLDISGNTYLVCFVVGVAFAEIKCRVNFEIRPSVLIPALVVAFYLYGYSGVPNGIFWPVFQLSSSFSAVYVWLVSASIIMSACLFSRPVAKALSGRKSVFLGRISFPLYLVHVPVVCSAGSFVYLLLLDYVPGQVAATVAAISTVIISVALAIGLAALNDKWLAALYAVPLGRTATVMPSSESVTR
jgi:peptidoglycan/LPS O-acetylase OafA/YrhL